MIRWKAAGANPRYFAFNLTRPNRIEITIVRKNAECENEALPLPLRFMHRSTGSIRILQTVMKAEEVSISALEHELMNEGYVSSRSGTALSLESLRLEVLAHATEFKPNIYGIGTSVVFEARLGPLGSAGIGILAVGYGETEEAAARDAARQWVTGVLPALHSYREPREDICQIARVAVETPKTGEPYGWDIHMAPVICRRYGKCDFQPEICNTEIFGAVFEAVNEWASRDSMFWLECFAVRNPDGSVDATCRYNNKDWPEGQKALISWASTWPDTNGCVLSKRQFLIFNPVPTGELSSSYRSSVIVN